MKTLDVCSLVPAGESGSRRWKTCTHSKRTKEYIRNRFITCRTEYYCRECGITLDQPEDRYKKPQLPRKLARNEKWCPVCGRIFRPKYMQTKYCSDECREIAKNKQMNDRNSLGTPSTVSLGEKSIKREADYVRCNIDRKYGWVNEDADSPYEIELEDTCYFPGDGESTYSSIGNVRDEKK